jgi:hypothetical protein
MVHKKILRYTILNIGMVLVLCMFPVRAAAQTTTNSTLPTSIDSVQRNQPGPPQSLYVPDFISLEVVQQPTDDPVFVSSQQNTLTQFRQASTMGNSVGLLAHHSKAGKNFDRFVPGDDIYLSYADGKTEHFVVTKVYHFKALDLDNPWGNFIDLENGKRFSAKELFYKVYGGSDYHLTLQTCIETEESAFWGRLFVIAEPIKNSAG